MIHMVRNVHFMTLIWCEWRKKQHAFDVVKKNLITFRKIFVEKFQISYYFYHL